MNAEIAIAILENIRDRWQILTRKEESNYGDDDVDDALSLAIQSLIEQSIPVQEQHKEEYEICYRCGHSLTLTFTGTNEEIAIYIRGHEAVDCPACFAEKQPFYTAFEHEIHERENAYGIDDETFIDLQYERGVDVGD